MKSWMLWTMLAVSGATAIVIAQQTASVAINGKASSLETISRGGKVFVDGVAFAKALGASATLTGGKLSVTSGAMMNTQGTAQQAGGAGVLGKSYTLGREKPLNFLLKSAEFQIMRLVIGREIYAPNKSEKLLLLRATIQNPQKEEAALSNYNFKFTAVDANNENRVFANFLVKDGSTAELNTFLKPAQKIEVVIPIIVPASGTVPKLIVENKNEAGTPVLRYDLSKSIKGLSAPYAAANNPFNAPPTVAAKSVTYYPAKEFDLKLEGAMYSTEALENETLEPNQRYLVATFTAKNPINTSDTRYLLGLKNDLKFSAVDTGDDMTASLYDWYKVSRPEEIADYPQLSYNQESKFRIAFKIPKDLKIKGIKVTGMLRDFVFDASSIK